MTDATKNKIVWVVIAAGLIGLFLLGRSCGIKSVTKNTGRDTVTVTHADTVPGTPKLVGIRYDSLIYRYRDTGSRWYDTLWGVAEVIINPVDTAALLADYYASRFYKDSQTIKGATVVINDTVSRNRITGRQIILNRTDTTITNTITLRPPKRIVGYFTTSVAGSFSQPFGSAGVGLGLKMPSDHVIQAEWKYMQTGKPMGEVRVMWPIRLIKRK